MSRDIYFYSFLLTSCFLAQISRSYWLRYLFTYWWLLLPSLHQSCHCHTSSVHARRRCPSETPASNAYSSTLSKTFLVVTGTDWRLVIAKMLQNLANKQRRHTWTLNPFVENNKARINQFLNNLCEVGDFYDTLEVISFITPLLYLMLIFSLFSKMDQYMALSKMGLMIHITMNELYNTHSLILQHVETLVCYFICSWVSCWHLIVVTERQATSPHPYRRAGSRTAPGTSKRKSDCRTQPIQPVGNASAWHPERTHGFSLVERHAIYGDKIDICAVDPFPPSRRWETAI